MRIEGGAKTMLQDHEDHDQEPRHSDLPVGNWVDPDWPGPGDGPKKTEPQATRGCGDNGCVIEKPKGMGTNGGCRCSPIKVKRWALEKAAQVCDAMPCSQSTCLAEQIRALK